MPFENTAFGLPVYRNGTIQRRMYANLPGRHCNLFLHVIVWERSNGPLPEGMVVHHINGDPTDNRAENLVAMSHRDHRRLHEGWHYDFTEMRTTGCSCSKCGVFIPIEKNIRLTRECRECRNQRKKVDDAAYRAKLNARRVLGLAEPDAEQA